MRYYHDAANLLPQPTFAANAVSLVVCTADDCVAIRKDYLSAFFQQTASSRLRGTVRINRLLTATAIFICLSLKVHTKSGCKR